MTTKTHTTSPDGPEPQTVTELWKERSDATASARQGDNAAHRRIWQAEDAMSRTPSQTVAELGLKLRTLTQPNMLYSPAAEALAKSARGDVQRMDPEQRIPETARQRTGQHGPGFAQAFAAWENARDAINAAEEGSEAEQEARRDRDKSEAAMVRTPAHSAGEAAMKARLLGRIARRMDALPDEAAAVLAETLATDLERLGTETPIPAP